MIRAVADSDRALIFNSWLGNFKLSNGAGPVIDSAYWDAYTASIEELTQRDGFRWAVIDLLDNEHHVAAWIAWLEPGRHDHRNPRTTRIEICGAPALLYVYTKEPYRRNGHAKALLAYAGIDPKRPFCWAYKTSLMSRLVYGDKDHEPNWTGGQRNFDTHFVRHLRKGPTT